jgi:hypothetical protein
MGSILLAGGNMIDMKYRAGITPEGLTSCELPPVEDSCTLRDWRIVSHRGKHHVAGTLSDGMRLITGEVASLWVGYPSDAPGTRAVQIETTGHARYTLLGGNASRLAALLMKRETEV